MNRKLSLFVAILGATVSSALADTAIESVQQKLKDQGFYYGEITGKKDTDTVAAIRRYQIRNGLQITGDLDAETQRSLGVSGRPAVRPTPRPAATAAPKRPTPPPEPAESNVPPVSRAAPDGYEQEPAGTYAPGPRGLRPETSGIFDGTPFEVAPPDVQRRVIIGAQSLLARRGFYRSSIDGVYGPGTAFAVRAYQSRMGLSPNGNLDLETLGSLGLLPGESAPAFGPPRRRIFSPRSRIIPGGERIYIPN